MEAVELQPRLSSPYSASYFLFLSELTSQRLAWTGATTEVVRQGAHAVHVPARRAETEDATRLSGRVGRVPPHHGETVTTVAHAHHDGTNTAAASVHEVMTAAVAPTDGADVRVQPVRRHPKVVMLSEEERRHTGGIGIGAEAVVGNAGRRRKG